MREEWREYFKTWSKTEEFKEKVRIAINIIDKALNKYDKCFISFSGGKDSTTLMNLVLKRNKNILVVHWDYGRYFIPRPIFKEIVKIIEYHTKNYRIFTSQLYEKYKRSARNILGRHFIGRVIPILKSEGYECAFIGLRAEEGVRRRERTKNYFENDKSGIVNCYPIRDWSWRDVWAYIISNKVPYLKLYDKYAELLGYDKVRFVTLFDPEFDRFGTENIDKFIMWKYYWLE